MTTKLRSSKPLKSPRKPESASKEVVKIIPDHKSSARTKAAKNSKGHDERGRYGKSVPDAETNDSYPDKPQR